MHKLWVKMAIVAQDSGDSAAQYLPAVAVGREAERGKPVGYFPKHSHCFQVSRV